MKKNRIFGLASVIALLAAGACSNDVIDPGSQSDPNEADKGDGAFVTVTFDLPSAKETRSYTDGPNSSSSGTEVGHDYENAVSDAYIVLAKVDNSFIAAAKSDTPKPVGTSGRSYSNTAKFTKTELAEFYTSSLTDADKDSQTGNYLVNVFVFANPTDGLKDVLDNATFGDKDWVNKKGVYDEVEKHSIGIIWNKDHFLMSNSGICTRYFPSSLDEWDSFTSETSAFNLSGMNNYGRPNEIDNLTAGNISVERAAARYDFRDGALDGIGNSDKTYNGFKPQTYHVVLDSDENPLVNVFLGKMSMINMNKNFYFLRRVSNNGLEGATMANGDPNDYRLCGPELPWTADKNGNYVVDADAVWKVTTPSTGFSTYFNYPFFNDEGVMDNAESSSDSWYTSLISKVLAEGASDSWISGDVSDEGNGKYKTWRYLTEGTIPDIDTQQYGISNGIVFKGQLQPARAAEDSDDEFTKKLLNALNISEDGNKLHDPILYEFGGHIYCTWEHIKRMAIYLSLTSLTKEGDKWKFTISRSTKIYNAVFGTGGFGEISFTCDGDDLKNANFLKPSDDNKIVDTLDPDQDSANAKYNAWKTAYPGSDEDVDDQAELLYFDAFRKLAVDKGIKFFQTSYDKELGGWGYYCYYFYWNRHNDNGMNGVMAGMEFDVVRNNVYKLAVTKIARLGHPRIAANDPDAPTPNTPDEHGDVYITVTCTTLPWVVRENEIVFN